MIIYCITNKINGKRYIGQTRQSLEARTRHLLTSYCFNVYLCNAVRKYGEDAFLVNVLEECLDQCAADFRERCLILEYGSRIPNGYNIAEGGNHPPDLSGRKLGSQSEDRRKKISQSKLGKSIRSLGKSCESKRGNQNARGHFFRHTDESKRKIWESRRRSGGIR